MKAYILVLFCLFLSKISFSQGEAAVPFLELNPSQLLTGAGNTGTAVPVSDASGFYYNPAQLGYSAGENRLSLFYVPEQSYWGTRVNSFAAAAGYNLSERFGIPLTVGMGYMNSKFTYDHSDIHTPPLPERNTDSFDQFSFGVGYDYYLQFSAGIGVKSFKSTLADYRTLKSFTAAGTAMDYGIMITAPVSRLFFDNSRLINFSPSKYIKPVVNFNLGYSLNNVGDEIYYINEAQSDPIPRTARLGYSFDLGLDIFTEKNHFEAVRYQFIVEAEDVLIAPRLLPESPIEYEGATGEIKVVDNLILVKGDNRVALHKGHIINFFETFIMTYGRINGRGYYNNKSEGIALSSRGVFKLLSNSDIHPAAAFVFNHLDVQYYFENGRVNESLVVSIKRINF